MFRSTIIFSTLIIAIAAKTYNIFFILFWFTVYFSLEFIV